jgi:hypothetical protein
MWRTDSHEETSAFGSWSTSAKVRSNGAPDIDGQRKTLMAVALAAHDDLALAPVDVIELHGHDFARSKTQANKHLQDSEVAKSHRLGTVTGREHPLHLITGNALGQTCISRASH